MRPSHFQQIAIYFLLALLVLSLVVYLVLVFGRGGGLGDVWWLWPVVFVAAFLVIYLRVLLPWNARRVFFQQKESASPFEHEITETAFNSSGQYGSATRPWVNFHKWKEDKDLLMLYLSDVMFIVIPKRFCTPEQVDAIRARLVENKIPQTRPNPVRLILLGVFFFLLIVVAVTAYQILAFSLR
jgi:hypothetical protein